MSNITTSFALHHSSGFFAEFGVEIQELRATDFVESTSWKNLSLVWTAKDPRWLHAMHPFSSIAHTWDVGLTWLCSSSILGEAVNFVLSIGLRCLTGKGISVVIHKPMTSTTRRESVVVAYRNSIADWQEANRHFQCENYESYRGWG